jgi:tRNA pseudouridine13 synthase
MDPFAELPYITGHLPGIGGKIKESVEDFRVDEVAVFDAEGGGQHMFVNLTRSGITTRDVLRDLSKLFELKQRSVGYAGLKDKYAVASQTFSMDFGIDRPSGEDVKTLIEENLPFIVNWAKYHSRKLKSGQLRGNNFTINITGLEISRQEALDRTRAIVDHISSVGLPNYYGPQRVGEEGKNLLRGYDIIKGELRIHDRWLRRFLVSSYLNHVFNLYLAERIKRGHYDKLILGDIAKKTDTGGLFIVEDLEKEQPRYEKKEISFTAPIYGPKMWFASGPSGDFEMEMLEKSDVTLEELKRERVRGTRRVGRLTLDISVIEHEKGIQLQFFLPKGAYATILLREIMKSQLSFD